MIHDSNATAPSAERAGREPRTSLRGLTDAEAAMRAAAGLGNAVAGRRPSRGAVVRRNVLTFFSLVLAVLIATLLLAGELHDGLLVGATVIANVAIATL